MSEILNKNKRITLDILKKYKDLYDAYVQLELTKKANLTHTHEATEIIESAEKKFVSDAEKALWADKYTKQEINEMIGSITKLTVEVVEKLPKSDQKENVIYLVPTGKPEDNNSKDEYMWINGKWEMIGTTQIPATQIFKCDKSSFETSDEEIISSFFAVNDSKVANIGDIFIIRTFVDGVVYELASYIYNGTSWEAITGNVDADKVILREDIVTAGNYSQVGNITKAQNGTGKISTKGKSVAEAFKTIFTQKLQPTITSQPSVSGFSLSGAKAVEAGTEISVANFGTASLSAGSYTYGPATGIVATSYQVDRVCTPSSLNANSVATASSGSDNNGGLGFIIGDDTSAGDNVVSSLKYVVTVSHGEGSIAKDNLGGLSEPNIKIASGTKQQTTSAYTPYRNFFYGATNSNPELDSNYIRSLTKSNKAYTKGDINITVPAGATRVCIACISSAVGVTKVINTSALNADVTSTFTKTQVEVEGFNGYVAKTYNVWTFEPAVPYEQTAVLKVTLG